MFWNPATMTQFSGIVSETDVSGIFPYASHTPTSGFLSAPPFNFSGTSNVGNAVPLPAGYTSYQLSPNLWVGLSINAPFGLSENFPDNWAGRFYASGNQLLKTYNATPSLAWRINDWISVGVGVQIQYAKAIFEQGLPGGPGLVACRGHWAEWVASNASRQWLGLWCYGWRNSYADAHDHDRPWLALGPQPKNRRHTGYERVAAARLRHPVLSPRQSIFPTSCRSGFASASIRGGHCSVRSNGQTGAASEPRTSCSSTGPPATALGHPVSIPFQWQDGWFFSGGAEYIWTDRLTVRGGIGYEISPVTDQVRTPIVPDNDRFWASIGATWQVIKGMHFDVAYSHIWVKDPNINLVAGNPSFLAGPPADFPMSATSTRTSTSCRWLWSCAWTS